MSNLWTVVFYGLLTGVVGTATGGLLACFLPKNNKRIISFILEYSAGLMTAIVCFDLLPNAFEYAPLAAVIFGLFIGVALMMISENIMNYDRGKKNIRRDNRTDNRIKMTGIVIALGIAIHNLLEGLAVGSGFEAETNLGITLAIAIMLHDIPEGMSIAVPLRAGGTSRTKAFFLTMATGLPTALGALIGAWAGQLTTFLVSMCLSVAGGAMLYIIFANMLPESKKMYGGRFGSFGSILGIVSGIIITVKLNG